MKIDVATKFSTNFKLTGEAKKYFELLVLFQNSKTIDEKKIYIEILESLRPKIIKTLQSLSIEAFRIISDWYHAAILELVGLFDFQNDAGWIKNKLGNEISSQYISKAIILIDTEYILNKIENGSFSDF